MISSGEYSWPLTPCVLFLDMTLGYNCNECGLETGKQSGSTVRGQS